MSWETITDIPPQVVPHSHPCSPPAASAVREMGAGAGSVWLCDDCGLRWNVSRTKLEEDPVRGDLFIVHWESEPIGGGYRLTTSSSERGDWRSHSPTRREDLTGKYGKIIAEYPPA